MDISPLAWLEESGRMVMRAARVRLDGFRQYPGDAREICSRVVRDCWNGAYLQTSTGHFTSFFSRDFGICAPHLMKLGYQKEVLRTLEHAMQRYLAAGRIATTVTPSGRVVDIYAYGPDSLAFLLHSLRVADAHDIVAFHREFLEKEITRCHRLVWDAERGQVKSGIFFTSMKDHAKRSSSLYDNVMVAFTARNLDALGLPNPWKGVDFDALVERFWTGDHYLDDLQSSHIAGDANIFPFWTEVVKSRKKLKSALSVVREAGLDSPLPLRYTNEKPKHLTLLDKFAPNYEGTTVWAHIGMLYIEVLATVDPKLAREHLGRYARLIEKYRTFVELFAPDETPYRSLFYYADEGMLWAAMFLGISQALSAR